MDVRWQGEPSSFRDPRGFVFWHDGHLYRQVNRSFGDEYRKLLESGLYAELVEANLLVSHRDVPLRLGTAPEAFTVIQPARIPFISYPYEWSFSQLKAAALLTIDLQKRALRRGLILRDASAYNVQFVGSQPIFIDTLSFGSRVEGAPWIAYRQFCEHFLAPLALSSWVHADLAQLARVHMDGIPLDVAGRVLPSSTWLRPGTLMHLHLHGRSASRENSKAGANIGNPRRMTLTALLALADSLERTIHGITWKSSSSVWSDYADECNYTQAAQEDKRRLVGEFLDLAVHNTRLETVWDLGANTGDYSRIAAAKAGYVLSFDLDHVVVERHFRACAERRDTKVLPLLQNLANPSGSTGWHHSERQSLIQRGPADAVLALALIHHLAIGNNLPLAKVAEFLRAVTRYLIVEFVPKEDPQVLRMLATREDIFNDYTQQGFEEAFQRHFTLIRSAAVAKTVRTLYLMERR